MLEIAATAFMLGLLAPAPGAAATAPRITSAYTTFDWQECPVIRSGEQEAQGRERPDDWQVRRCDGYAGIPLIWKYDDGRDDLDAGVENRAGFDGAHSLGPRLEWRLRDGKPFAIIYRAKAFVYRAEAAPELVWSRLIVETIGQPGKPGCSIAMLDASKPNANIAARKAADAVLTGKAQCISLSE